MTKNHKKCTYYIYEIKCMKCYLKTYWYAFYYLEVTLQQILFFFLFFASQVSTVLYNMYIVHTLLYVQYKICILPSIESNLSCMIASLAPKSSSHKAGRFPSRVCWAEQKVALSLLALKSKFTNIIRKYNQFIILNYITVHYSSSLGISFILMSPY